MIVASETKVKRSHRGNEYNQSLQGDDVKEEKNTRTKIDRTEGCNGSGPAAEKLGKKGERSGKRSSSFVVSGIDSAQQKNVISNIGG